VQATLAYFHQIFPEQSVMETVLFWLSSMYRGGNHDKLFLMFIGTLGYNSKSKFAEMILQWLGAYGVTVPIAVLTYLQKNSGEANSQEARMVGARFVAASETGVTTKLSSAKVRSLTGNDRAINRKLHQEATESGQSYKIAVFTSTMVQWDEYDEAMRKRARMIKMDTKFSTSAPSDVEQQVQGNHYPEDPTFERKIPLLARGLAYLAYVLYDKYKECKPKEWIAPDIDQWTTEFWKEMDIYESFIAEKLERVDGVSLPELALWNAFTQYWVNTKKRGPHPEQHQALNVFDKRFSLKRVNGAWNGYRLKNPFAVS